MKLSEMYEYCDSMREEDGFCRVCCSCSGPSFSNLECDYEDDMVKGVTIYRGGNHGGCRFEIEE